MLDISKLVFISYLKIYIHTGIPIANGRLNVKNPKSKLLFRLDLNSFKSSSNPAINIMYNNPIVENKSIALLFSKIFNPEGPIITPDIINPIIPGIFNFLRTIGESKIIERTSEKINIGLDKGI
jgi:hypothetical protein